MNFIQSFVMLLREYFDDQVVDKTESRLVPLHLPASEYVSGYGIIPVSCDKSGCVCPLKRHLSYVTKNRRQGDILRLETMIR